MKNRILSFALALMITLLSVVPAFSLDVSAESAVLMCVNTGDVLFEKNSKKKMSMASTTKIMTALLTLESGLASKEVRVTEEMVSVEGTSMGLKAGDFVSVRELVYGMLLQSGNDAANAAAYVVGGSPEGFAELMNARAKEIGMKNTNFVTASGLDADEHYTTAYDMALLAKESLKNPEFAAICSQKTAKLSYGDPPYERVLKNHNRLLWSYRDAVGIKTGFTKKSGRCLVSAAERNGITLVAVTLNAPNDWDDHVSMLEEGFEMCKPESMVCEFDNVFLKVCGGTKTKAAVEVSLYPTWVSGIDYSYKIFVKPFVYAPVCKGDIVGYIRFYSNKTVVAETELTASENVKIKFPEVTQSKSNKKRNDNIFNSIKTFISDKISEFRGEILGG